MGSGHRSLHDLAVPSVMLSFDGSGSVLQERGLTLRLPMIVCQETIVPLSRTDMASCYSAQPMKPLFAC
jgi:hypothetical protein